MSNMKKSPRDSERMWVTVDYGATKVDYVFGSVRKKGKQQTALEKRQTKKWKETRTDEWTKLFMQISYRFFARAFLLIFFFPQTFIYSHFMIS